jgi:hypothetical protein
MHYLLAVIFAFIPVSAPPSDSSIPVDMFVAQPDSCYYWEHWKFLGKRSQLRAFRQRSDLSTGYFNDKISSVRCTSGCYLNAYEHAGFQGESMQFFGDTREIGEWNDRISSVQVFCPSE